MAIKNPSTSVIGLPTVLGTNYSDTITVGTKTIGKNGAITSGGATTGDDIIAGGNGDDIVRAGAGNDIVWGDSGSNSDLNDNGQDTLYGDDGNDELHGGNGKDYLDGGADHDKLYGDNGVDILYGNTGADDLYGGNAGDVFLYKTFAESGSLTGVWNRAGDAVPAIGSTASGDWIRDFETGSDKIDLGALNPLLTNLARTGPAPSGQLLTYSQAGGAAYGVWISTDRKSVV